MLALECDFDRYFFLEKNPNYFVHLRERIQSHSCYADKKDRIIMDCCDSNKPLQRITEKSWRQDSWRGVMFLDPYALSVEWTSLQQISQTGIFDVWYLFPIMAMLRCLRREGGVDPQCINVLNRILGTEEWRSILYCQHENPQYSLPFDDADTTDIRTRRVDMALVRKYVIARLKSVFPFVLDNPLLLYNEINRSPLFMLCFACSNKAPGSHKVASRIAGHLCEKHRKN
jgi:three-Cys-motif partner protein